MPDELVLVVAVGHPWHGKREIGLADLRAEPLLLRERGSGTRAALESALAQAGLDLSAFRIVGEMGSTQAPSRQNVAPAHAVPAVPPVQYPDAPQWASSVRGSRHAPSQNTWPGAQRGTQAPW